MALLGFRKRVYARDIMQRDVPTIHRDESIEDLVRFLFKKRVTGAPVVDDSGQMVGIISEADVTKAANWAIISDKSRGYLAEQTKKMGFAMDTEEEQAEEMSEEEREHFLKIKLNFFQELLHRPVSTIMTRNVITVKTSASLSEICRILADNRIHRLVVARDRKIFGMIEALDVLRAVSHLGL